MPPAFPGVGPRGRHGVREGVDSDNAGALAAGEIGEVGAHGLRGEFIGEYQARVGIVEHGPQVGIVAGLAGIVQRHGGHARIQGAKEAEEVLRGIAHENGHALAGLAHLLQASGHGLDPGVDLGARVVHRPAGALVIPVAQGRTLATTGGKFLLVEQFGQAGEGEAGINGDLPFSLKNEARAD